MSYVDLKIVILPVICDTEIVIYLFNRNPQHSMFRETDSYREANARMTSIANLKYLGPYQDNRGALHWAVSLWPGIRY